MQAETTLLELAEVLDGGPIIGFDVTARILEHDETHSTEYSNTLLTYFECGGNISAIAARMKIHPNTCRYRLARARELFDVRFDDPDAQLLMWLRLRLAAGSPRSSPPNRSAPYVQ